MIFIIQKIVDDVLVNSQRIIPSLQYTSGTYALTKTSDNIINFSFRPTNCSCNLKPIVLVKSFEDDVKIIFS